MSTETQAPLNPEVEATTPEALAQVEETEEVVAEEVPPAVDYSKLLQKEQMARANMEKKFEKKFDELLDAIKSGASQQVQANKADTLKSYLESEEGKTLAASTPGLTALIAGVAAEAAEARKKASDTDDRQAARERYEEFMADKPSGFREAYSKEQRRLMDEIAEEGFQADETAVGIAMMQWSKRWMKSKTAPVPAVTATGVSRVLPAAGVKGKNPPPKPTGNPFGWTVDS